MAVKTYQDSKDKYLKEKVDTFVLRVPKGKKDEIMEYAKSKGMSLNGYITELIFADMGLAEPAQKKAAPAPKAEKAEKTPKAAKPKKAPAKPAEKPVQPELPKETVKEEKAPVQSPVQEVPAQEEEVKKKKMPSFLL